MAQRPNVRVRVPSQAKRGEVIEIRAMIMHAMETGFRSDTQGTRIPMHIIHTFICRYNGAEILRAELGSGISANPYFSFSTEATESGEIELTWVDDDGSVYTEKAAITVT